MTSSHLELKTAMKDCGSEENTNKVKERECELVCGTLEQNKQ
jgi:hypothetical protein